MSKVLLNSEFANNVISLARSLKLSLKRLDNLYEMASSQSADDSRQAMGSIKEKLKGSSDSDTEKKAKFLNNFLNPNSANELNTSPDLALNAMHILLACKYVNNDTLYIVDQTKTNEYQFDIKELDSHSAIKKLDTGKATLGALNILIDMENHSFLELHEKDGVASPMLTVNKLTQEGIKDMLNDCKSSVAKKHISGESDLVKFFQGVGKIASKAEDKSSGFGER